MKYFWLIGYFIIFALYGFIAYLMSDYTASDYSYWMRVIWCGGILSLMYLSIGTFQCKASHQNLNTPLFIVFTMKMLVLGGISIAVCIRSYFFHPDWMQVVNLITQGCIAIYLVILVVNLIFVGRVENMSQQQLNKQRSYNDECKQLFLDARNNISPNNSRLLDSVRELFDKTILMVKTDAHILKINRLKDNLLILCAKSSEEEQYKMLQDMIIEINSFYR